MCGRYSFSAKSTERFASILGVGFSGLEPRYNIAPGQQNPVIYRPDRRPLLRSFTWGLVPHWLKEPQTKYSTINAKVETVSEKPLYRDSFHPRLCLVSTDRWYE